MFEHLDFIFSAFQALWTRRQFEHITFSEIEAFARIYSVYDVERFATLIMHCDQCVHDTAASIEEERDRLEELANLKGKK